MKNKNSFIKVMALLCATAVLTGLTACADTEQNIIFTATIESISDKGIVVQATDRVGFDLASVSFADDLKVEGNFIVGQTVELEILPQIAESYPVQVKAVGIKIKEEKPMAEYKFILPEEAKEMMDGSATILDVRTQAEFDEGHIEGAVLLPDFEIKEKAEELLTDKDEVILVYCRSGNRSASAAKELIKLGYTNVFDFGGIINWPYEVVK